MHQLLSNEEPPSPMSKSITKIPWQSKFDTIINQNFMNNSLLVPQVAKKMGISERSLHYKVKKLSGLTPSKYINEFRLIKAKELLEKQVYNTVTEVCYAVGFQTPAYFSRQFKKRFGKSPSEYLQF